MPQVAGEGPAELSPHSQHGPLLLPQHSLAAAPAQPLGLCSSPLGAAGKSPLHAHNWILLLPPGFCAGDANPVGWQGS